MRRSPTASAVAFGNSISAGHQMTLPMVNLARAPAPAPGAVPAAAPAQAIPQAIPDGISDEARINYMHATSLLETDFKVAVIEAAGDAFFRVSNEKIEGLCTPTTRPACF